MKSPLILTELVLACQGRVTLPCKSLRGVRVPNTSSPLRSVRPEYTMSIIQSIFRFQVPHMRGKSHQRLLVHRWKTRLMLLNLLRARHPPVFSMKPFHLFLRILHTFAWFPHISMICAPFPFHKIPKLLHRFIPSSNLSRL